MNRTGQNIVLTTVSGLGADHLRPFVASFRRTRQPSSSLTMFVNASCLVGLGRGTVLDQASRRYLLDNVDQVVWFKCASLRMRRPQCILWPVWKRVLAQLRADSARRRLARHVFSFVFLRFLLYLDYLDSLPEKPNWVFLTDSRDVVFQEDIFSRVREPGLYCFLEAKGRTISQCPTNSRMISDCFGPTSLAGIKHNEISCSGTVLGDFASIHSYLRTMFSRTLTVQKMPMASGNDQGLHNYIVHNGLVPGIRLVGNESGPVGTFGNVTIEEIRRSHDNLLLQPDGRAYAVLHQHDRHPIIVSTHPAYKDAPSFVRSA